MTAALSEVLHNQRLIWKSGTDFRSGQTRHACPEMHILEIISLESSTMATGARACPSPRQGQQPGAGDRNRARGGAGWRYPEDVGSSGRGRRRRKIWFALGRQKRWMFHSGPGRSEITSCDRCRSSNANDRKPACCYWRNISVRAKWAKLFNLSRSVTSSEPVLFRRPARYTSAYSRRGKTSRNERRAGRSKFPRRVSC